MASRKETANSFLISPASQIGANEICTASKTSVLVIEVSRNSQKWKNLKNQQSDFRKKSDSWQFPSEIDLKSLKFAKMPDDDHD